MNNSWYSASGKPIPGMEFISHRILCFKCVCLEWWWYKDDEKTFPMMDGLESNSEKLDDLILSLLNRSFEAPLFRSTVYGIKGDAGLRNALPDENFLCICYKKNYDDFQLQVEATMAVIIILIFTIAIGCCIRLIIRP